MFVPFKKSKAYYDSDDLSASSEEEKAPQKKITQTPQMIESEESEIEEINSNNKSAFSPEREDEDKGFDPTQPTEFFGNKSLQQFFGEQKSSQSEKEKDKKASQASLKSSRMIDEEDDIIIEDTPNKNTFRNWLRACNKQEKIEVNTVGVYNLEARVNEKILFELFSKIGKIKRLKLFRISSPEIQGSQYLQTLDLGDETTRPHKKRAEVEYHAPNYAENAVEVFNGLSLYGRKIIVLKKLDHQLPKIQIIRKKHSYKWLDEYFCTDYFTNYANFVRAFCFSENDIVKLKIIFTTEEDFEEAKKAIESELLFFASDLKVNYYLNSNSSPREERRANKLLSTPAQHNSYNQQNQRPNPPPPVHQKAKLIQSDDKVFGVNESINDNSYK